MSEKLGYDLIDLSQPSTSIMHMVLGLNHFLKHQYCDTKKYLALFFLTAKERQLFFADNGQTIECNVARYPQYYKDYYTDELGTFNANLCLFTLQRLCQLYSIEDHYLFGWQSFELWPDVDRKKIYDHGQSNAIEIFNGKGTLLHELIEHTHPCVAPDGHPNAFGHQKIAEYWLKWIIDNSQ